MLHGLYTFELKFGFQTFPGDKSYLVNTMIPMTGCQAKVIPEDFFPSGFWYCSTPWITLQTILGSGVSGNLR